MVPSANKFSDELTLELFGLIKVQTVNLSLNNLIGTIDSKDDWRHLISGIF